MGEVIPLVAAILLLIGFLAKMISRERKAKQAAASEANAEALFRSMFPDLLPSFHPRQILTYVRTRNRSALPPAGKPWIDPPGIGPGSAFFETIEGRERVRLLDKHGRNPRVFFYEPLANGAIIRLDDGKFTVDSTEPRVKYWGPRREFKWQPRRKNKWAFKTPVSDGAIGSSDSGSTWSSGDTSGSSPAGVAPLVAGGGTFDGGGASHAWDGGGRGGGATSY